MDLTMTDTHDQRTSPKTPDRSAPELVGVIGLGFLGKGIATCLLGHGFRVVGCDRDSQSRSAARQAIEQGIHELIEFGQCNTAQAAAWNERYKDTGTLDGLSACEFVIESVTEDRDTKQQVFSELESLVDPSVVIGSNTSAIPISALQAGRRYPKRFVGMHWAEPAHATRFMELIPGEQTSADTVRITADLARRCRKEPCVVQKDVPGFIVNRIGYAMYREALHLIESGVADAETIDTACRSALGLWATMCGPLQWIDLTGGPAAYADSWETIVPSLCHSDKMPPMLQKLADENALGVVNGHGFFEYTKDEAELLETRFRKHAWAMTQLMNDYSPLDSEGHEKE